MAGNVVMNLAPYEQKPGPGRASNTLTHVAGRGGTPRLTAANHLGSGLHQAGRQPEGA